MATDEVVQMNTRIGADIKRAGDAAFARAGYTPSQVVRKIWELAAEHANEPDVIRGMLEGENVPAGERASNDSVLSSSAREKRVEAALKGRTIVEEGLRRLGIPEEHIAEFRIESADQSYKDLLEEALWERYMEKNGA